MPLGFDLKEGDIFFARSPMWIGSAISFVDRIWSLDAAAVYSHSGVIIAPNGDTFEASWHVTSFNFCEKYIKDRVAIFRYKYVESELLYNAMMRILKHEDQFYPVHRLFLHFFRVAHFFHWDKIVCSELSVKFLCTLTDDPHFKHWFGWTPDHLYDLLTAHRDFDLIFEGTFLLLGSDEIFAEAS